MDWIRAEKLGHGSFATVDLAVPRNHSSFLPPLMAVKSCGVSHSSSLMSEKVILDELKDCPQVIQCYGESFSYENGEKLYNILLEYAPGGALSDTIKTSGEHRLPEIEARRYTKSLLKGLNYIHKAGYVHCDIKLQNILLGPNGSLKIADFGLAKKAGQNGDVSRCQLRGTPMYMSPEVLADGEQGAPADIWAVGCLVSEMVGGSPPWRCSDVAELIMRIGGGAEVPEIPANISEEGKDFLSKCFVKDPSKRWTAEMLLDHPFVCGQDFVTDESNFALKEASTSPRCPFDFPDWTSSITSLPSPEYSAESDPWFSREAEESWSVAAAEERLIGLVSEHCPDWSVSDDWVTVR